MEVVLELWIDEEEEEGELQLGEELQEQDEATGTDQNGNNAGDSGQQAAASRPRRNPRVAKLQADALQRAYKGEGGRSPWFPEAANRLAPSVFLPSPWTHSAPLQWLAKQPALLGAGSEGEQLALNKQRGSADADAGCDLQTTSDLPVFANITAVSPLCLYIPSGTSGAVQLAVSGTHLSHAECKASLNQLVSQSRAVLLVDDDAIAMELQQLSDESEPASVEANDALIRDLGSWMEYSHERRSASSSHAEPCGPDGSSHALPAAPTASEAGASDVSSALDSLRSLLPASSSLQASGAGALQASQHTKSFGNKMLSLGLHLLEHAVGAGWCTVSTRIVHDMMEVHGLCLGTIFQLATSGGLPLLHRAICSCNAPMLHNVLRWGDVQDHEWDLDQLVPTRTRKGRTVHVSALHLAAALGDQGYAAELLLLKYAKARRLWNLVKDSRGFMPSHYALLAGNTHLEVLANRLTTTPDRLFSSDEELTPWNSKELMEQLPQQQLQHQEGEAGVMPDALRLPGLPRLSCSRAKGKRIPRTSAVGLSNIGKFLEQAVGVLALPPGQEPGAARPWPTEGAGAGAVASLEGTERVSARGHNASAPDGEEVREAEQVSSPTGMAAELASWATDGSAAAAAVAGTAVVEDQALPPVQPMPLPIADAVARSNTAAAGPVTAVVPSSNSCDARGTAANAKPAESRAPGTNAGAQPRRQLLPLWLALHALVAVALGLWAMLAPHTLPSASALFTTLAAVLGIELALVAMFNGQQGPGMQH